MGDEPGAHATIAADSQPRTLFAAPAHLVAGQAPGILTCRPRTCRLPEALSYWRDVLDECLVHDDPSLQDRAVAAAAALSKFGYFDDAGGAWVSEQTAKLAQAADDATVRGISMLLGAVSRKALRGQESKSIATLVAATTFSHGENAPDARAAAVLALASLVEGLGVCGAGSVSAEDGTLETLRRCIASAAEDYTVNSHGDVGSRVREAAMMAWRRIILHLAATAEDCRGALSRLYEAVDPLPLRTPQPRR